VILPSNLPRSSAGPAVAACPTKAPTLETLIGLRLDGGPLGDRYGDRLNERALACFKSATLTFTAFVAAPEGLGGTFAYQVAPDWLDTWNSEITFLAASDREAAPGAPFGPFLPVAVPPDVRPAFDGLRGHWVTVNGRMDSPTARICVATRIAGTDVPQPPDLVEMCRTSFVVEWIKSAADPCPATVTLRAILATPDGARADCFGGAPVSFVAAGSSINNVWPGLTMPSGYGDWVFGVDGLDIDTSLAAFVPDTTPFPDPAGTPWRDRDGVGGLDAYWRVTGHFDDELADECLPREGDTMEAVGGEATPIVLSRGDVHDFCRNHFVVDRLTWLPGATASSVAG
jgi:hypothetical protein